MKKDENANFFDARTLLAIVIAGLTFVAWQTYMQKKYPEIYNKKTEVATTVKADGAKANAIATSAANTQNASPGSEASPTPGVAEKLVHYISQNLEFDISSKGMGVKGFKILAFKNRKGETVEIGHPEEKTLPLETRLLGRSETLDFQIEQVNPNLFVGHAQFGTLRVTKTMEVDPGKYTLNFKIVASGFDDRFVGLTTSLTDELAPVTTNFLMPQHQKQEFFVETTETHDRTVIDKHDLSKTWNGVKIAGLGSQYFTQAIVDHSQIIPEAKGTVNHASSASELILQYPVLNRSQDLELSYLAFVGPKSLSLLLSVDAGLARVVDFGFFSWIGQRILQLLRAFYSLVGNWGLAIICLTLLVRVLVLPLNIYSYKSMKVMQTLQPQIKAMRERYKDDQQKQQQEMMALMKSNKANPLAGCMPVLLQFPIFIALYQVLGNSIELYQAPFGLWIHDLSLKDPFYILPVLMGLTMFVQQKITPNTMDPAQAKMMMIMPFIFTFFMISLPSGLTLYMLVGAVFSVAQQSYFLKQSKSVSKA